ncbi:MAG: hypothetical protein M3459_03590 [Actinomycetota bacterium]|nr:hypothetical protein [Actinomycetota bacterium]
MKESDGIDQAILELWFQPLTLDEIGRRVGRTKSCISVRAKRLGLPPRVTRIDEAERHQMADLYERHSIGDIARWFGRDRATVRQALVLHGATIRDAETQSRRWMVRRTAFATPLSAEAAYWLGFLAADGSVHQTVISLYQMPECEAALRRFLAFVGCPDKPLLAHNHGLLRSARVHSRAIVNDLAQHGVLPAKSLSLTVSAEAAGNTAFWLGALDGDGCICFNPAGRPTMILVGAKPFLEQFSAFVATVVGRRPAVCRAGRKSRIWATKVSGDSAKQLAIVLLAALPVSLERKRPRLMRAAKYSSSRTEARLAPRSRPCSYCGKPVYRFPSQLEGDHVFCDRRHAGTPRRHGGSSP